MHPRQRATLFAVFAVTGFSALTLQVVWQRVMTLHAGVDLFSFTTVVAAFLAGLGLGSVLGGVLADRLGARRSLLAFAASNAGIGLFAWFSLWLFYDVYRSAVPHLGGTLGAFAFHFALLVVPTTLMGLSLPLVSRGLVERVDQAGPLVGRLYAVNTLGAGLGAGVSGWILVGSLGFVGVVRLAGTLNLLAALSILTLWRTAARAPAVPARHEDSAAPAATVPTGRTWPWFVVYGLTGAVALGLEIVFFRLVDALMRSNSYTFGHVLALYLLLFGAGAAVASRLVGRVRRPDRWFLGIQFAVGVLALVGPIALVELPPRLGVYGPFERQFAIDGYNVGGYRFDSLREVLRLGFVHLFGPLLIMGLPVLAMGASFPFVQRLVAERVETLGRRTGLLLLANIAGNVAGTLVVGFLLIDRLGTSGTLRLLAALLLLPGLAAAAMARPSWRRPAMASGAVALMLGLVAVFPSNFRLWAYLHSAPVDDFALAEDRACVNALRKVKGEDFLFINATSQNGHPFDDFHVLIGLLPALLHPDPQRAMAVGLGIGATPYGMSRDPRLDHLDVVEICGGEVELLGVLARRGAPEVERLLGDPRVDIHVGDGRKFLLGTEDRYDVLTVDVVRPQAAFSGNLYSVEFYELLRSRLDGDGLVAQWIATPRVLNSATEVFPHVMRFPVASYYGSQFMVASQRPLVFDRAAALERFRALQDTRAFSAAQTASISEFLATVEPSTVSVTRDVGEDSLNRDLAPRDEYFLNNSPNVHVRG